jgi:hypothetical protein
VGAAASAACAQADKSEHSCAKAAKVVARGKPEKKDDWAWATIVGCGSAASPALRDAWARTRTSADTNELEDTYAQLWSIRDAALFDAAKSIFMDADATPQSRVFSGMLLLSSVSDDVYATYGQMTASVGVQSVCSLGSVADRTHYLGTALPTDAPTQLQAIAQQLIKDPATPTLVRSAARCIASELAAYQRANAKPSNAPLAGRASKAARRAGSQTVGGRR